MDQPGPQDGVGCSGGGGAARDGGGQHGEPAAQQPGGAAGEAAGPGQAAHQGLVRSYGPHRGHCQSDQMNQHSPDRQYSSVLAVQSNSSYWQRICSDKY